MLHANFRSIHQHQESFATKLLTVSYEFPAPAKAKPESPFSSHYFYRNRGSKSSKSNPHSETPERFTPSSSANKEDHKRGLNVGVRVASPTSKGDVEVSRFLDEFESDLLHEMDKTLKGMNLSAEASQDDQLCGSCEEVLEDGHVRRMDTIIQPASHCDKWDSKTRTCWFERNIGDTVTFVLATLGLNTMAPKVTWKKEFYVRHSSNMKEFAIEPVTSMWNIAIGRRDMELRLSPITETDVDFNRFSATIQEEGLPQFSNNRVHFQIKVVPIDLGFVYLGETLELNMGRFCNLPNEGISYQWLLESETDSNTLPSNMKISPSGSSVTISELRKEQEGVISCAAYTGFGAFVAKRRFLIREISENNDISLAVLNLKQHHDFIAAHRHPKLKRARRNRRSTKEIEEEEEFENVFGNVKRAAAPSSSLELGDLEFPETSKSRNRQESGQFAENSNQANRDFPETAVEDSRRFADDNVEISEPRVDSTQRRPISAAAGNAGAQEGAKYPYMRQSELPVTNVRVSEGDRDNFPENIARQSEGSETENDAQQKQTNILVNIDRKVADETHVMDKVSKFMAPCYRDRHCSGDAVCMKARIDVVGVCHCSPGYRGDGIFCDKEATVRVGQVSRTKDTFSKLPVTNERQEARVA